MQRGQDKVPGQGGLDSDLRRLAIPDLADEHNVGVLTQDAAQAVGERHVRLDIDLHLVESIHLVLDRVLHRDDVLSGRVETVECGVQGRCLAGAGGAGDDNHTIRLADDVVEQGQRIIEESKVLKGHHGTALVQDAQNDLLAVDGGQRTDAEVDGLVLDAQGDTAVLGLAPLGDIHIGHDLDAREHAGLDVARQFLLLLQDTVDTVADAQVVLLRLHVDIRRALDDGLGDEGVDQPNDGRVLTHLAQLLDADLFATFCNDLGLRLGTGFLDGVSDDVVLLDGALDGILGSDEELCFASVRGKQVVHQLDVGGVTECDADDAFLALERDKPVALSAFLVHQCQHVRRYLLGHDIYEWHVPLFGQDLCLDVIVDEPLIDENLQQWFIGVVLSGKGSIKSLFVDISSCKQDTSY